MKNNLTSREFDNLTLKPGEYLVVDTCYVFGHDWNDFCHELFKYGSAAIMTENKTDFFVCGTAYGDGEFNIWKNGESVGKCGVDAGLLSVIPMSLVKKWNKIKPYNGSYKKESFGGTIIKLEKECEVVCNGDGNFSFGDFEVITDGSDYKYEDEDERY